MTLSFLSSPVRPGFQEETLRLTRLHETEPLHVRQVARLAVQLFDLLTFWHCRDNGDRELLESAAFLHDIGWSQTPDGKSHHKWSARLIHEFRWTSIPEGEVAVLAQIARYHRKALPCPDHEDYQRLAPESRKQVAVLGAILRVADGLDRTHRQRVQKLHLQVEEGGARWVFRTEASDPIPSELEMAKAKADLLEREASVEVFFPPGQ